MKYIRKYTLESDWEDDQQDREANVPVTSWLVDVDEVRYDHEVVPLVLTSESNPEVFTILDEAGFEHVDPDGYTAEELGGITDEDFYNEAYNSDGGTVYYSIFFNSDIETFDEFQYFTGITIIRDYAFSGCADLSSIVLPNSVVTICGCNAYRTYIGDYDMTYVYNSPFQDTSLTSLTIPNSVVTIGNYSFKDCTDLTSLTLSDSVTTLGQFAFSNCNGLTSITIPNSVTMIRDEAFRSCTGLTSITLGRSVNSIGGSVFNSCVGLTSIIVDTGNATYDSRNNCNAIIETNTNTLIVGCNNTTIPNTVTSIGNTAFYGRTTMTSITIPSSVTSIGPSAFYNCIGLTSLTLSSSLTEIGNYAFYACRGLTSVTIPNLVTIIGQNAFANCTGLTSVIIGNSVTTIDANAFDRCTGLISATIGNSVTSIAGSSFSNCTSLRDITWNAVSCSSFTSSNNPFKGNTAINTFTFGNTVKYIPDYICYQLSGLASVTIGNSVTTTGANAFNGCTGLTSVTWNAITHNYFSTSSGPFRLLTGITSFVFGSEVERIPDYICKGLRALTTITIPNSATMIGTDAFNGCTGLTSVNIGNSVTTIGSSAFRGCSGLTSVAIPNSVITLNGFGNCTGLTSITIPSSVTTIGIEAFSNCTGLASVNIGNSVSTIDNYAFNNCTGLTEVTIPNSVTTIGYDSFRGCSGMKTITSLATTAPVIQSNTFQNIKTGGTLHVPSGANYSTWMQNSNYYLGLYNWTIAYDA